MTHDFPYDADGDALRRLVDDGSDLTKPMCVEFQVAVPDEAAEFFAGPPHQSRPAARRH